MKLTVKGANLKSSKYRNDVSHNSQPYSLVEGTKNTVERPQSLWDVLV